MSYRCADSVRKESSKQSKYFLTVVAVIRDFLTVRKVFFSFSGLVSFVGLLVPHIVRRLFGQGRHRVLIPAAALLGASFVTSCDLLSRVIFAPYEIPVGILLSFLGGPFFLFLIVKQRRHHPKSGMGRSIFPPRKSASSLKGGDGP